MSKLKRQANWCKYVKNGYKDIGTDETKRVFEARPFGPVHIPASEYGKPYINGMHPITNRYIKQLKQDLKREYRAAKRSEKQDIRKEIDSILLEGV